MFSTITSVAGSSSSGPRSKTTSSSGPTARCCTIWPAWSRIAHTFVQAEGITHGQIIHALRLAVTGKTVGFGLFESLAILGKPQCVARIERALARL